MAAFTASQASVTNGSKVVTINSSESIANIRQGDFLFLAGFLVEINRGYVGGSSQQYIELVKNWTNSSQSNQPALVVPTTGDFRAAVDAINNANKNVNDNFVAMQNWQTKMGSVTFVNQDGSTTTVKTLKQIEADNATQMDAYHPYPWAMRKVEFEARRAANNEKYAASGFVHFGKAYTGGVSSYDIVAEGLWINTTQQNRLRLGRSEDQSQTGGDSKKGFASTNISGITTKLEGVYSSAAVGIEVRLPPAEDGTRTYDSATGVSVKHATPAIAFASETATNKVVTNRVDMWGFEAFLREINDADPFVYKNGLIQSIATNINGVATATDNARLGSYFAWYDGESATRGKGVNWQTASESQRIAIASDPENNIYFDDSTGKFYQWSLRGCSFAGMGNGDWKSIESNGLEALAFKQTHTRVKAQGKRDSVASFGTGAPDDFVNASHAASINGDRGIFNDNSAESSDGGTGCYFLVCGTVNRLNKGAYHPSFNSSGTAYSTDGINLNNRAFWDSSSSVLTSTLDTFTNACTSSIADGSIGTTSVNGRYPRPDGHLYDAIYASGQGGVCRDMRYSAWGLTQDDFSEADLAIKSGKYRGREKMGLTKLLPISDSPTVTSSNIGVRAFNNLALTLGIDVEDAYYVYNVTNGELFYNLDRRETLQGSFKSHIYYPEAWGNSPSVILIYILKQASVAGEFLHTDVIGDPAKIILCDDLKDGWNGSWNPTIPDGSNTIFPLSRKYSGSGSDLIRRSTLDNGNAWSGTTTASLASIVDNTVSFIPAQPANQINIYQYKTGAKTVVPSENTKVYGGAKGVGVMWCTSFYAPSWGTDLVSSAINKLIKNSFSSGKISTNYKLISFGLRPVTNTLDHSSGREPEHATLELVGTSGDVAFKALNYNAAENQQGFINYVYTELKHDGPDWGDDGKVHIVNNQSTMLDENGNTVLVGTARCVEPLGWIKNDK